MDKIQTTLNMSESSSLKRKFQEEEDYKVTFNTKKRNIVIKKVNIYYEEINIIFEEIDYYLTKTEEIEDVPEIINLKIFEIKKILYNIRRIGVCEKNKLFGTISKMIKYFYKLENFKECIDIFEKNKKLTLKVSDEKNIKFKKENINYYVKSYLEFYFTNERFDKILTFFENRFKGNIESFLNEIELYQSENNRYIHFLGASFYHLGEFKKAICIFNKIEKEDEEALNFKNLILYETIGDCYFHLGNYEKAKELFNKIGDNFKRKDILIYKCNNEIEKKKNEEKHTILFETARLYQEYELGQELLYKINIECDICKNDKSCKYLTRCFHTMCLSCKFNIEGGCPFCRREDWKM
jgi:tetratricopeptide (TPR) repeat protein